MKHMLMMLAGCVLPFFLIFLLPLFGIADGMALFIGILLMFACHLFMGGHRHGEDENRPQDLERKEDEHEHS